MFYFIVPPQMFSILIYEDIGITSLVRKILGYESIVQQTLNAHKIKMWHKSSTF